MEPKNNGFIFTETLVSISIMLVLLISFYTFSIVFIENQSKNKNYEKIENIYKVANVRLFLYRNTDNFNNLIDKINNTCISLNNIEYSDETNLSGKYSAMKHELGIDQMYLCDFEQNVPFTDDFKEYFEFVKNKFKDKYRIIAHFSDTNSFASVKVWRVQ